MNEVKTSQEVIMKEAKTRKESIVSKANYLSNRQTSICGGMKGILTFLMAFVLFGFSSCSSCKSRENEPVPVDKAETDDPSTTLAQSDTTSPLLNRAKEIMKKVDLAMARLKEGRLDVDAQKTYVNTNDTVRTAEALVVMLRGALEVDKAQIAAQAMGKEARALLNNSAKGADNEGARVELGKVYKAADDVALEAMRVELDAMWMAAVMLIIEFNNYYNTDSNAADNALNEVSDDMAAVNKVYDEAQKLSGVATRDSSKLDKAWEAVRNTQKKACDMAVVIMSVMNGYEFWQQGENASALKKAVTAVITATRDIGILTQRETDDALEKCRVPREKK
jgi:hypothetical protein